MAVIEHQPSPAESDSFESAKLLTELAPAPSAESLSANADDIFATIRAEQERGRTRAEGYRRAVDSYIAAETDPHLRAQAQIILGADRAVKVQKKLEEVGKQLKAGPTEELREERKRLVGQILPYNHLLRDFVFGNSEAVSRPQVENWLERGSGGQSGWAKGIVAGFAGEVALTRSLSQLPEIRDVRLSNIDEDRRGIDIMVTTNNGRDVPIDVKTGGQAPMGGYGDKGTYGVEIGLSREEIDGFEINPSYQREVTDRVRSAIF